MRQPVVGAEVRAWRSERHNRWIPAKPVKTDKNGLFRFQGQDRKNYVVLVQHEGQKLSSANNYYLAHMRNMGLMAMAMVDDAIDVDGRWSAMRASLAGQLRDAQVRRVDCTRRWRGDLMRVVALGTSNAHGVGHDA